MEYAPAATIASAILIDKEQSTTMRRQTVDELDMLQVRIGVFPRCSPCKRQRSSNRYCGTETAVKGCLNWPPKKMGEPKLARQAVTQATEAHDTAEDKKPVLKEKHPRKGKAQASKVSDQDVQIALMSGRQEEQSELDVASPCSPQDEARRLLLGGGWTDSQLAALQVSLGKLYVHIVWLKSDHAWACKEKCRLAAIRNFVVSRSL